MKKKRKILWLPVFLVCLLTVQAVQVFGAPEIPRQTSEFYVNDFADVLSEETETYVVQGSKALAEETKACLLYTSTPAPFRYRSSPAGWPGVRSAFFHHDAAS